MRTFLLVDDSPTVLLGLRQAIRKARGSEAHIVEARDVRTALERIADGPDVVFLDLVLPGDTTVVAKDEETPPAAGIRLLQDIIERAPQTRVIVATGLPASHPDVVDAVSLGAAAVLRKPVRPEDVRATLDALEPAADTLSYFG